MQRLHPSVFSEEEMHRAFSPDATKVSKWEKLELRIRYYTRVRNAKFHAAKE
jgi:hypothetical protein